MSLLVSSLPCMHVCIWLMHCSDGWRCVITLHTLSSLISHGYRMPARLSCSMGNRSSNNRVVPEPTQGHPAPAPAPAPAIAPPPPDERPVTEEDRVKFQDNVDHLLKALDSEEEQDLKVVYLALSDLCRHAAAAVNAAVPGAGMVMSVGSIIFAQLAIVDRVNFHCILLSIDVALINELFFNMPNDDHSREFWSKKAGRLHLAMLKRAIKQAGDLLQGVGDQSGLVYFFSAKSNTSAIGLAIESLEKARHHFCESLITNQVLSMAATLAIQKTCDKYEMNERLILSHPDNPRKRALFFNPGMLPNAPLGLCMGWNESGKTTCEKKATLRFSYNDGGQVKYIQVCGTHGNVKSVLQKVGVRLLETLDEEETGSGDKDSEDGEDN